MNESYTPHIDAQTRGSAIRYEAAQVAKFRRADARAFYEWEAAEIARGHLNRPAETKEQRIARVARQNEVTRDKIAMALLTPPTPAEIALKAEELKLSRAKHEYYVFFWLIWGGIVVYTDVSLIVALGSLAILVVVLNYFSPRSILGRIR
jgi:hypothetical protein